MRKIKHPGEEKGWAGTTATGAGWDGLDREELELLQQAGRMMHAHDGQWLFDEGDMDGHLFLILDGKVKAGACSNKSVWVDQGPYGIIDLNDDEEPQWESVRTYHAGKCLGEHDFFQEKSHSFAAVSDGESDLLVLDVQAMQMVLQENPQRGPQVVEHLRRMTV